jgi:hypothetical protein
MTSKLIPSGIDNLEFHQLKFLLTFMIMMMDFGMIILLKSKEEEKKLDLLPIDNILCIDNLQ